MNRLFLTVNRKPYTVYRGLLELYPCRAGFLFYYFNNAVGYAPRDTSNQRPAARGDEKAFGRFAAHEIAGLFLYLGQGEAGQLLLGLDLEQGVHIIVFALVLNADGIGAGKDVDDLVSAALLALFGLEDLLRDGFAEQHHGIDQRFFAVVAVYQAVQLADGLLGRGNERQGGYQ